MEYVPVRLKKTAKWLNSPNVVLQHLPSPEMRPTLSEIFSHKYWHTRIWYQWNTLESRNSILWIIWTSSPLILWGPRFRYPRGDWASLIPLWPTVSLVLQGRGMGAPVGTIPREGATRTVCGGAWGPPRCPTFWFPWFQIHFKYVFRFRIYVVNIVPYI